MQAVPNQAKPVQSVSVEAACQHSVEAVVCLSRDPTVAEMENKVWSTVLFVAHPTDNRRQSRAISKRRLTQMLVLLLLSSAVQCTARVLLP
jgi:hypothetical protein